MIASLSQQNALVFTLEGFRDVVELVAAGSGFVLTGNLLTPFVGAAATQLLFSTYQRRGFQRIRDKRKQELEQLRSAGSGRKDEVQDAMAALRFPGTSASAPAARADASSNADPSTTAAAAKSALGLQQDGDVAAKAADTPISAASGQDAAATEAAEPTASPGDAAAASSSLDKAGTPADESTSADVDTKVGSDSGAVDTSGGENDIKARVEPLKDLATPLSSKKAEQQMEDLRKRLGRPKKRNPVVEEPPPEKKEKTLEDTFLELQQLTSSLRQQPDSGASGASSSNGADMGTDAQEAPAAGEIEAGGADRNEAP